MPRVLELGRCSVKWVGRPDSDHIPQGTCRRSFGVLCDSFRAQSGSDQLAEMCHIRRLSPKVKEERTPNDNFLLRVPRVARVARLALSKPLNFILSFASNCVCFKLVACAQLIYCSVTQKEVAIFVTHINVKINCHAKFWIE